MRYSLIIFLSLFWGCGPTSGGNSPAPHYCDIQDNGGPWIALAGQSNAYRLPLASFGYSVARFAVPGSPIEYWTPGGDFYGDMLDCVGDRPIEAVVWIQGEADAKDADSAAAYYDRLAALDNALPLTIVLTSAQLPYTDDIRAAQLAVDPDAIETNDLDTADGMHFTPAAQEILIDRIEWRLSLDKRP